MWCSAWNYHQRHEPNPSKRLMLLSCPTFFSTSIFTEYCIYALSLCPFLPVAQGITPIALCTTQLKYIPFRPIYHLNFYENYLFIFPISKFTKPYLGLSLSLKSCWVTFWFCFGDKISMTVALAVLEQCRPGWLKWHSASCWEVLFSSAGIKNWLAGLPQWPWTPGTPACTSKSEDYRNVQHIQLHVCLTLHCQYPASPHRRLLQREAT